MLKRGISSPYGIPRSAFMRRNEESTSTRLRLPTTSGISRLIHNAMPNCLTYRILIRSLHTSGIWCYWILCIMSNGVLKPRSTVSQIIPMFFRFRCRLIGTNFHGQPWRLVLDQLKGPYSELVTYEQRNLLTLKW